MRISRSIMELVSKEVILWEIDWRLAGLVTHILYNTFKRGR